MACNQGELTFHGIVTLCVKGSWKLNTLSLHADLSIFSICHEQWPPEAGQRLEGRAGRQQGVWLCSSQQGSPCLMTIQPAPGL